MKIRLDSEQRNWYSDSMKKKIMLGNLWFTQRKLNRSNQIPSMIFSCLPTITLQQDYDGEILIINGHHRAIAMFLSGKKELEKEDYVLDLFDYKKNRYFQIKDQEKWIRMINAVHFCWRDKVLC